MAIALVGARVGALLQRRPDRDGQLLFDQGLQCPLEQLAEQSPVVVGEKVRREVGQGVMISGGHRVASFREILRTDLTNGHTVAITVRGTDSDLHHPVRRQHEMPLDHEVVGG